MNRLSVLSANLESTVNDVLDHANFRKIADLKFITIIRYGENNAYISMLKLREKCEIVALIGDIGQQL